MAILLLLAQSLCMFIASFGVGSIPLWFKSSMTGLTLKSVTVLGMGLLVGAALTIIIPEGVMTLFESLPDDKEAYESKAIHAIGLSLLLGFALMLMIEALTPHPSPAPPPSPDSPSSPSSSLDGSRPLPQHMNSQTPIISKHKRLRVADSNTEHECHEQGGVQGLNATLGMVIHGAADGIALGASSLSGSGSLGLIVFLAVLVHKGPTALGLTTTLLSLGLTHASIRRRLIIFSFAAPVGAIITYVAVRAFGSSSLGQHTSGDVDALQWWTGIALLFSGGSFLYVATVIQPLSSSDEHSHAHHTHPESGEHHHDDDSDPPLGKYQRTALLVAGMGTPVLLSLLVGDQH